MRQLQNALESTLQPSETEEDDDSSPNHQRLKGRPRVRLNSFLRDFSEDKVKELLSAGLQPLQS